MEPVYHNRRLGPSPAGYFLIRTALCYGYLMLVQLAYSLYHTFLTVRNGTSYQAPFGADLAYLAAMWIPFSALVVFLVRRSGLPAFLSCCRETLQKHWFKFGMYFLLLYGIRQNLWVGDYYVELPGGGMRMGSSFGAYLSMHFVHFLGETVSVFLLFLAIPFFWSVSWSMRDVPPGNCLRK